VIPRAEMLAELMHEIRRRRAGSHKTTTISKTPLSAANLTPW
jgi:hypothetical protein